MRSAIHQLQREREPGEDDVDLFDGSPEPPPITDADAPEWSGPARLAVAQGPAAALKPIRFVHRPFDEFIRLPGAESEPLTTYLYRGALSMFNGEPGGTKTWLLLHEGLEAARKGRRVVYCALEGQKKALDRRLERLTAEDDWSTLRDFFHISYLPGMDDDEGGRCFKLTDEDWIEAVIESLSEWRADVFLADPLADAMDGDPDKEADVRPAKEALKKLRFKLNVAIGLGHHTMKRAWANAAGEREVKPSKADARGSGSWMGTAEISVDVTPTSGQTPAYGEALVTATKAKDYPEVPQERVFNVTDSTTAEGRTVVVTALHDPAGFKGSVGSRARYRKAAIQVLRAAPGGCLTRGAAEGDAPPRLRR